MDMYGRKDRSLPQKWGMVGLEGLFMLTSFWILFGDGFQRLLPFMRSGDGNDARHVALFVFNCIVFLRMTLTFFYFVKRHIPVGEAIAVPFAFALYYMGFALLGYGSAATFNYVDYLGIILFCAGSLINTGAELQRNTWKGIPAHQGHLYTGGLFSLPVHINHFGEVLWVTGYALVTRNPWSAVIPVFLLAMFIFWNIPRLDAYLSGKYGTEFKAYSLHTKRLIPFVY